MGTNPSDFPVHPNELVILMPAWITDMALSGAVYASVHDRAGLAIDLARRNVREGTGGPFGAAVFDARSGRAVALGVNLVVPQNNCVLHAETVAIMFAQQAVRRYSLKGTAGYELAASCDPCAMCLGAVLWSGVRRLITSAPREAALEAGFEEGPVFPESYAYLVSRGIQVERGIRAGEAADVIREYRASGGEIYNG